jgi:uncharacterized membrane protein YgdD (TMEM256/DUF423 family)
MSARNAGIFASAQHDPSTCAGNLMVATGARALGAITPLGGALLIAGWIALLLAPWWRR